MSVTLLPVGEKALLHRQPFPAAQEPLHSEQPVPTVSMARGSDPMTSSSGSFLISSSPPALRHYLRNHFTQLVKVDTVETLLKGIEGLLQQSNGLSSESPGSQGKNGDTKGPKVFLPSRASKRKPYSEINPKIHYHMNPYICDKT
jgi:hypothetical protein